MPTSSVWSLISSLFALIVVIVLAYLASKWIAKRYSANGQATNHMAVLDKLPLGQDRMLYVVKVGEKTMLLGVTPEHIEKLDDVDDSIFPVAKTQEPPSFKDSLKIVMKNNFGVNMGNSPTNPMAKKHSKHLKISKEENNDIDNV